MTTTTPLRSRRRRSRSLAVLVILALVAGACSSTSSLSKEAAPVATRQAGTFTIELPAEWDTADVTPVSLFNNARNLNGKFKSNAAIKNKAKFADGKIFQANRFNQNKKFSNSTAKKKLFNSNSKVFNQQFNEQFKKFNGFNNFNMTNKKFGVATPGKKLSVTKANNFNNFNNFNNKGFNNFNTFGVNGFKGFNTNQFLKKPGRFSVFGWVSFEELDADLVADLDDDMMEWIATGENPKEMTGAEGLMAIQLDESFSDGSLRGHRTVFDMDVGDGEIQRVAQQTVVNAAGDQMVTFVAGCEVECFEEHETEIMRSMNSIRFDG